MSKKRGGPEQEAAITMALATLKKDPKLSIRKAAIRHGVPYRTLYDRKVLGRQSYRLAHVLEQKMTPVQEAFLVKYAKQLEDSGIPAGRELLQAQAQRIIRRSGNPTVVLGTTWIDAFLKRHPTLQMKRPETLERQRKLATDPRVFEQHLTMFRDAIASHQIKENNIWNMDEKGFMLGKVNKVKVVCRRGRGPPILQSDGSREWVTVLEAVSGTGHVLSACIVWKGKYHLAGQYVPGVGKAGTRFACTPNGWTSNELAQEWLEQHFEPVTRPRYVVDYPRGYIAANAALETHKSGVCSF